MFRPISAAMGTSLYSALTSRFTSLLSSNAPYSTHVPSYRRMPRKYGGYGITASNLRMFRKKLLRNYTKEWLKNFGKDDIESVILHLASPENKLRKVSEKKRMQLTILYTRVMTELVAEEEALSGILISKIEVPSLMQELKVYWCCSGDVEKDAQTQAKLDAQESSIRRKMQETFYNAIMPPLKFIPDRRQLAMDELNKLFEIADYGMQYRAVSPVGAALGSSSDTGVQPTDPLDPSLGKEKAPPRWMESWRRRVKAREEEQGK